MTEEERLCKIITDYQEWLESKIDKYKSKVGRAAAVSTLSFTVALGKLLTLKHPSITTDDLPK